MLEAQLVIINNTEGIIRESAGRVALIYSPAASAKMTPMQYPRKSVPFVEEYPFTHFS
jgi:hypothetical protein